MRSTVTITVETGDADGRTLLAPAGAPTPYETCTGFAVEGGDFDVIQEAHTGQDAALIRPSGRGPVTVTYSYSDGGSGYPEPLFIHRPNRYTTAADELAQESQRAAGTSADGHAAIAGIANEVAQKFRYGHAEVRFNDGMDEIPYLSCGLTEGSCVDINSYLIASLRAAGFEAGYVTGYFFPEEKNGVCDDMHCWVVTRHHDVMQEWDIAHHLKLGKRDIEAALNPKPGVRRAVAHSMGLDFPDLGIADLKLMAEPVWLDADGTIDRSRVAIRFDRTDG